MSKLVSYIIPCFNSEAYILQSVKSVFTQKNISVEAVVVDDGSSDQSLSIVRSFASSNPQYAITICTHDDRRNKGVSASRRLGLDRAKGEYICFLDSDDYLIDEWKSALQLDELCRYPSLVMVHCGVIAVGRASCHQEFVNNFRANSRHGVYNFSRLDDCFTSNHVCNSTVMIKRSALESVAFDSPQCFQYEDWALWLLLSRIGSFKCIDVAGVAYRLHDSSATSFVKKNKLRHYYSLIECKLVVLGRCGPSVFAWRVLMSMRQEIVGLITCYLEEGASGRHSPRQAATPLLVIKALLCPRLFLRGRLKYLRSLAGAHLFGGMS